MNSIAASTMPISTATVRSTDHRQAERRQKNRRVAARPFGQAREIVPFAHVQRHVHQHGAQRGQRDEFRQRRGDENDDQQRDRVNDARHRRARAALHIRGRARDGAGGRDAAEERADDVGDALRHEFLVGIVPVVNHAVGHHRAEQRFDRRQQRDGHRRLEQMLDVFPRQRRHVRHGQRLRDAAELAADGLHRQIETAPPPPCPAPARRWSRARAAASFSARKE